MSTDVFPSTLNTWIDDERRRGLSGQLAVNHYVMSAYAWPLRVYYLGTNMRWLGEPDEIIDGFFASRLAHDDFYEKWRGSGKRLRHWLINALHFYLREQLQKSRRDRTVAAPGAEAGDVTFSGDPDRETDRIAAQAFVREAMNLAAQTCRDKNLGDHWSLFLRHHVDGRDFNELAREFSVDAARAAVMSRTAQRHFHLALREIIARDGVPDDQIDAEIQLLLERIS
jgi:hypothetical protein